MDTVQLLTLTPDKLDIIKHIAGQRKWQLTTIALENNDTKIIKFIPYHCFGNQGSHPMEHLAIELTSKHWHIMTTHYN